MLILFKCYKGLRWISRFVVAGMIVLVCLAHGVLGGQENPGPILDDDLFSVSFPSETKGWACGRRGTILHSDDGGRSWKRQESGTGFTLASIHFVDVKQGWAVGDGGTILSTVNGGKTWTKQRSPVPFFLMGVYFVSPQKGWAVGERTHILSTDNGGKTWTKQFSDADYILKAVSFADSSNGWAVGECGYIYRTRNGGTTWQNQGGGLSISEATGELTGGKFLFGVAAINPQTAWAVGIDGHVSRTSDGGKTWRKVETGAPKTQLYSIAADRSRRLVIGGNGVLLNSNDNGTTWKNVECAPPITYGWIYGIAKRTTSNFVAVGAAGAVYLSSGDRWARME